MRRLLNNKVILVYILGATLGLFVGFIIFSNSVRNGSAAAFVYWIRRPEFYWHWTVFGGVIAGFGFYIFHGSRSPQAASQDSGARHEKSRVAEYQLLIARAVAELKINDSYSRQNIYVRVRSALANQSLSKDEFAREQHTLERAIQNFENGSPREIFFFGNPQHRPATMTLMFSIFFPGIWVIDITCMSLYWVARMPKVLR